jgi:hypothetical protein
MPTRWHPAGAITRSLSARTERKSLKLGKLGEIPAQCSGPERFLLQEREQVGV